MPSSTEKLVPQATICRGQHVSVVSVRAYPQGSHPAHAPLVTTAQTMVELVTPVGSRWWGFERAWIGADLRMHVDGWDPRNEIVAGWDPDACLQRLIDAAIAGDHAEILEAAEDLATWLKRGGFNPKDPR